MLRLLFLSSISLPLLSGCSGDDCGPGDAPDSGLVAGDEANMLVFGGLTAGANNDCPDPAAPTGVISVTINGVQTSGGTGLLTMCVPRPDQLAAGVTLGSGFKIIDLTGEANGCTYKIESTRPVTGTAKATGVCDNGQSGNFALTIDGHISLTKTCTTSSETLAVNFNGTVAVD
jgi:hypothetical protein